MILRCRGRDMAAGFVWLLLLAAASPASALSARDLAGWWIAVDGVFPALWERGALHPMEELLIVNPDGRVENRVMNFWSGSARVCAETKVCSDAPMIATARLSVKGDRLSLDGRRPAAGRLDAPKSDPLIRRTALTATAAWTAAVDGRLMTLRAGELVRSFVRVEPRRLQRLRAGMRVSEQSATRHWRCFLANATARDPAFAVLRPDRPPAPDFLDAYLKVASYLITLESMSVRPTPDDPAAKRFIGHDTEEIMVEEFSDVRLPVTAADGRALRAKIAFVMAKARGTAAAGGPAAAVPAAPGRLAVSPAEIAAFSRGLGDQPEAKKLFCRE